MAAGIRVGRKENDMSRTVYVNGDWVAEEEARVSIFDRGFLMADAVYEVCPVLDGKILEIAPHMARLTRSLSELEMRAPDADIPALMRELRERNNLEEGTIYLQVGRGVGERDFMIDPELTPSLVMFTQTGALRESKKAREGIRVVSTPDIRWGRRDIKTVQLLASSLAKSRAARQGADDAWLIEDGKVTEGTSNNAFIVTGDGKIVTRNLSTSLLHGCTRAAVLKVARELQMTVEERAFTIAEAQGAAEAFMTSASHFAVGVVEIDGVRIGSGAPGQVTLRLREAIMREMLAAA